MTVAELRAKIPAMNDDLASLEQKLDQFLLSFQQVRAENQELRTRVASLEGENRRLRDKIDAAAARIETLMEGLPQP